MARPAAILQPISAKLVRWEMRTRLFITYGRIFVARGHTAHFTREEALEETVKMINVYASLPKSTWLCL